MKITYSGFPTSPLCGRSLSWSRNSNLAWHYHQRRYQLSHVFQDLFKLYLSISALETTVLFLVLQVYYQKIIFEGDNVVLKGLNSKKDIDFFNLNRRKYIFFMKGQAIDTCSMEWNDEIGIDKSEFIHIENYRLFNETLFSDHFSPPLKFLQLRPILKEQFVLNHPR